MSNGIQQLLDKEKYHKIQAGLKMYRIDSFIREIDAKEGKNKGGVLSFVRGLRLSALLIYAIRDLLEGSNLTANWGHIIDEDGQLCSRECDIIIHDTNVPIYRWNGDGGNNHVMDFRFIPYSGAKVVVSCKSYLVTNEIEVDYCIDLKKFVDRVWLFAECCGPRSDESIEEAAKKIGYENFWYLYKWSKGKNDVEETPEVWLDFVEVVKALR